jgi:uncharacterized protein YndB with AHSA1/START domain
MHPEKPKFVYVTLIKTTPEKLWAALTDPEFTQQYWFGTRVKSDWKIGSPLSYHWRGQISDEGTILECDPPRRLAYTFHHLLDDDMRQELPSRVTFIIEPLKSKSGPQGDTVRLTVTHEDFPPDSNIFPAISNGWPSILSGLKTLLETGKPLDLTWSEKA